MAKKKQDRRIGRILSFITRLAVGKKPRRLFPSSRHDEIDGIIVGLRMLAEELQVLQNRNEQSRDGLRHLTLKLFKTREEEKKKLSANLHDFLGTFAVAVAAQFVMLRQEIDEDKKTEARLCLKRINRLFTDSISSLKKVAVDLRPPHLTILGLPEALREYLSEMSRQNRLEIEFEQKIGRLHVSEDPAITLYRITQETLNNILQHACAKKVRVFLGKEGKRLVLTISDDGKGMCLETANRQSGKLGIIGMRERVSLLGGEFSIQSVSKKGTRVKVVLPFSAAM